MAKCLAAFEYAMRSVAQVQLHRLAEGSSTAVADFGRRAKAWGHRLDPVADLAVFIADRLFNGFGQAGTSAIGWLTSIIEPGADDIDIALESLIPGDPDRAIDIYSGIFTLAAKTVASRGRSIFDQAAPSGGFARELHGFSWLGDLAEAATSLAQLNARALIEDWLDLEDEKRNAKLTLEPAVVAARVKSILQHAAWLLDGSTPIFRQRLLESLTRDVQMLWRYRSVDASDQIRLDASLIAAAIAIPAYRRRLPSAMRRLDDHLKQQILSDGSHISRRPAAIVEILTELIPLKGALANLGLPASNTMMNAIDRMVPMLRFFLADDGTLARFNGASDVDSGLITRILAHVGINGMAHGNAIRSGYQRLDAGDVTIILDCGRAPPVSRAARAHAGTLAFELTSGTNGLVVNCGLNNQAPADWRSAARQTAAHSCLIIGGESSAWPIETGPMARMFGPTLVGGPRQIHVERREHGGAVAVVASHDGYRTRFNTIHERTLRLSASGDRLEGRDLLMPADDWASACVNYVIRFHLHPDVQPVLLENGVIMLMVESGEVWEFRADDQAPTLEASIFLADLTGPRATQQIVLTAALPDAVEHRWSFIRTKRPAAPQQA